MNKQDVLKKQLNRLSLLRKLREKNEHAKKDASSEEKDADDSYGGDDGCSQKQGVKSVHNDRSGT